MSGPSAEMHSGFARSLNSSLVEMCYLSTKFFISEGVQGSGLAHAWHVKLCERFAAWSGTARQTMVMDLLVFSLTSLGAQQDVCNMSSVAHKAIVARLLYVQSTKAQ